MKIELSCSQCGSNRFSLTEADDDGTPVHCEDCGHDVGTLHQLKQAVIDQVLRR